MFYFSFMKNGVKRGIIFLAFAIIVSFVIIFANKRWKPKEDFNTGMDAVVLRDGDLIFQTSLSGQSKAVQLATHSEYSHMGMIYKDGRQTYVFEAIQPVKLTPFKEWIARGRRSSYVVKRLKGSEMLLTPGVISKMKRVGEKYLGKNYDIYFEWTDDRIYCSELVWKIYKEGAGIEIGELEQLKQFDLSSEPVKNKLRERYGDKFPLNEPVISPVGMFNSNKLVTIYKQ